MYKYQPTKDINVQVYQVKKKTFHRSLKARKEVMDDSIGERSPLIENANEERQQSKLRSLWLKLFPLGFKEEFFHVLMLAWPAVLTSFFQFALQTTSIIMCGHLDKHQYDGAGLANSMINVLGLSIGMGMSTACDTLFSQTFGSNNKKRVGVYLQRSLIIMNMAAVLVCCVHINIEPILNLLGQNLVISKIAANYILYFLPGIFFDYNYLILARYLQNQNILYPPLVCSMIGNVVNIVGQYLCIYVYGFGYEASAICQASSLFVMMILEIIYIFGTKVYNDTWDGWSAKSLLCDWGFFARLAIPGIFLIGLEEWSFEVALLVSGTIEATKGIQLGIQTALFQIETICYMIPMGLSIAINIRVGQHLGGNRPEHAKTAYRIGVTIVMMTATAVAVLFLCLRDYIPLIFNKNEEIVNGISRVLILIAVFQYSDGIAGTASGALRGCGRQLIGAFVLFIGYYIISLPIGISLALLTNLKVFGLWVGLLTGITLEAFIFLVIVSSTNWEKQCEQAALTAYGNGSQEDLTEEQSHALRRTSDYIRQSDNGQDLLTSSFSYRSRGSRNTRTIVTTSFSRRATMSTTSVELPETESISTGDFQRVVYNRIFIFIAVLIIVAAAVVIRVFQIERCVPVTNVTIAQNITILPYCPVIVHLEEMFSLE